MSKEFARRLTHALNRIDAAYYIDEQGDGITDNAICVMYALDDGERHTQAEICRESISSRKLNFYSLHKTVMALARV